MCDTVKKKSKWSFSDNWLTDDHFKSWIHKVSFDDNLRQIDLNNVIESKD